MSAVYDYSKVRFYRVLGSFNEGPGRIRLDLAGFMAGVRTKKLKDTKTASEKWWVDYARGTRCPNDPHR